MLAPPAAALPIVEGGWQLVLADPPWRFDVHSRATGLARAADAHYPSMTQTEICALPVARVAARDSVLLLWTTGPMLARALEVIEAWGYTYKTIAFTWVKLNLDASPATGMGYYSRSNAEPCLLATRGRGLERVAKDVPQVLLSRRREHSRKPDGIYDRSTQLFGAHVRRLELFARTAWPGWTAWGSEVGRFPTPLPLMVEARGVMAEAHDDPGPSWYAELEWDGPYDLAEAIPGQEGVCWFARDEAAGWCALVEGVWGPDGHLRPGVRWSVSRPGGPLLEEGVTRGPDAAVLDAERYIQELLAAARAEQLLAQALSPGGGATAGVGPGGAG